MKTAHREAARAKQHARDNLVHGMDAWKCAWIPLPPTPAPVRRAGADDYLRHPSRVGDQRTAPGAPITLHASRGA